MNVDSLSSIMEFSKVKERRNLSCVSSLFKETFDSSRLKCTKIALVKLVKERREKMYFPIVESTDQSVKDCLPKNFKSNVLQRYLTYQMKSIYSLEFRDGMELGQMCPLIEEDPFDMGIVSKFTAIQFLDEIDGNQTILSVFEEYADQWSIDRFKSDIESGRVSSLPDQMIMVNDSDVEGMTDYTMEHFWNRYIVKKYPWLD